MRCRKHDWQLVRVDNSYKPKSADFACHCGAFKTVRLRNRKL